MRKVLIASGAFAVFAFITGSLFKTMYWPGASVLLTLGIGTFSLIFLPLLFIIKAREAKATSDKFVVAIGSAVGAMFSLAILFIVQHWPGANMLLFSAIGLAAFVLLPAYFFTGIRRPETKLNTIVMSIILVGVIGLQYTMVRLRPSGSQQKIKMDTYVQSETLLRKMQANMAPEKSVADINNISEELKSIVLERTIGQPTIPKDYESTNLHFNEGSLGQAFDENGQGVQLVARLQTAVKAYNNTKASAGQKIPISNTVLQTDAAMVGKLYSNLAFLNSILLIQMHLAIAENNNAVAVH